MNPAHKHFAGPGNKAVLGALGLAVFVQALGLPAASAKVHPVRVALILEGPEDSPEITWAVTLAAWQELSSWAPSVIPVSLYDIEQALFQCESENILGYPKIPAYRAEADIVISGRVSKPKEPKGIMLEARLEPTPRTTSPVKETGKTLFARDVATLGRKLCSFVQASINNPAPKPFTGPLLLEQALVKAGAGIELVFRRSCRRRGCPNDPSAGTKKMEEALALDPQLTGVRILLAEIYIHGGRPARAVAVLEPAETGNYLVPTLLGEALEAGGMTEKAASQFEKALEICPDCCRPLTDLAGIFAYENNRAKAMAMYQKAVARDPGCTKALFFEALSFQRQEKSLEKAVRLYQKAARLAPVDPDVHYYLGLALAKLGRLESAVQAFEKALEQGPDFPDAWKNLAVALLKLGKKKHALQAFENCLRYSSAKAPYRKAVKEQIRKLKGELAK